jgi:hypothetical protein
VDQTRETTFLAFIFIASLLLLAPATPRNFRKLVTALLVATAVRLLLFPHIEDRYFVATYAIIGIAAIITLMRTVGHTEIADSDNFAAAQITTRIVITK